MRFLSKIIVFISALFLLWVPGNARAISPAYIGTVSQLIAPTQIPGLALWLDAADTSTITQSGGAVSQWNDKSGLGRNATQGTGANQPTTGAHTINGKNVIYFPGTPVQMLLSGFPVSIPAGDNTVFMVSKDLNTGNDMSLLSGMIGGSPAWGLSYANFGANPRAQNGGASSSAATVNGSPHILGLSRTGTTLDVIYDGVVTTAATGANRTITSGYLIGHGASTSTSKIDVGDIIIYTRYLSSAEKNLLGKSLAAKWGVTWTSLP